MANKEFVCRACLTDTLKKLESMLTILQGETLQGTMTPTSIADNILSIMGQFWRPCCADINPEELGSVMCLLEGKGIKGLINLTM